MPHCPRCGNEVSEKENFCPKCGSNLREERPPSRPPRIERVEKREKEEKREKSEKAEKREKEEASPAAALVGAVVLIFIGVVFYLNVSDIIILQEAWPYLLLFLGAIIIVAAIVAGMTASRRHPRP